VQLDTAYVDLLALSIMLAKVRSADPNSERAWLTMDSSLESSFQSSLAIQVRKAQIRFEVVLTSVAQTSLYAAA
jgi:hypothetical protein